MDWRAFWLASVFSIIRCLWPRNSAEDGPDGHSKARQCSLAQDIAGHHFTRCEHIIRGLPGCHDDTSIVIHLNAKVSERNPRAERIGVKGRGVNPPCPMGLWGSEVFGGTVIKNLGIEGSGRDSGVEFIDSTLHRGDVESELRRQLGNTICFHRGEHGWHEQLKGLGIDDRIRDLVGSIGYEQSPKGINL